MAEPGELTRLHSMTSQLSPEAKEQIEQVGWPLMCATTAPLLHWFGG